jgi:phosphoserine aminotransferase
MNRPFNFSPGPATIPAEVLQTVANELLNYQGTGMSVMEMSHRGSIFMDIFEETVRLIREVLNVPEHFHVLFMQGGAAAQNALIPLNLGSLAQTDPPVLDYVVTGSWSQKSYKEGLRYGEARLVASNEGDHHTRLPALDTWRLSGQANYVHLCSNETIHGVQFKAWPDLTALGSTVPLIVDASSDIASHSIEWDKVGLVYAGAQKNLGPAGLTLVFVRDDLIGHALPACPTVFNYRVVADNDSMYNTPNTFAIYVTNLVFKWIQAQGGISAIERVNQAKACLLYETIDASGLYRNLVDPSCRSLMNVPFFLRDEKLNEVFLNQAKTAGLVQLKGHKLLGGMRASLYNAMPLAGVEALVAFMRDFEKTQA